MDKPLRLLLTGASGYLGHYLESALRAEPRLRVVTAGRAGDDDVLLDLGVPTSIAAVLAEVRPDIIVHAGALSRIATCEADPELATRVNTTATEALCAGRARVVFTSTDLVFDGEAAPYTRAARPAPRSEYGASKVGGEHAVLASRGGLVVRLPLLFGRSFDGRRGATDMLRSARADGREVTLFTDEFRTPLHVASAARAVLELALDATRTGIVHAAGGERVSRMELGERFLAVHPLAGLVVRAAERGDASRPRDVSLVPDWVEERELDEGLGES